VSLLRSIAAGLALGLAGLIGVGLLFALFWTLAIVFKTGASADIFKDKVVPMAIAGMGIGSFVGGTLGWRLFVDGRANAKRGALAGALAGVVAHPFCWFFILLMDGAKGGELIITPLLTGAFSAIIVGWATAPVPILAGAILGRAALKRR
jgi:hypothetical protein